MIMFFLFMFSAVFIALGVILYIMNIIVGHSNDNYPSPKNKLEPKICILITVKDNEKYIRSVLNSITKQTHYVDMKDVYIMLENDSDNIFNLIKEYNFNLYVKKWETPNRRGYALDELVRNILEKKKYYDMYIVLDEDTILDDKYVEKMVESYNKGYDIAVGYKNNINSKLNITETCGGLFLTSFNSTTNKNRTKKSLNITILDSGYFISGDLIEIFKGFPFHSLNENYELSVVSAINNFKTGYNEEAIYFSSETSKHKTSINERAKQIKGYFFIRHKYKKELQELIKRDYYNYGSVFNIYITLVPLLLIFIGVNLILITSICSSIYFYITNVQEFRLYLFITILTLFSVYIILVLYTIFILLKEGKKINLSLGSKLKAVFLYPFYLLSYVNATIKSYFI